MRVRGLAHQVHTERVLVDEEHRVLAGVRAALDLGLEEQVVGGVVGGHVHLRAVQHVRLTLPASGGLDRVHVGAGAGLGDRVALVPLAADGRHDPALELLGRDDLGCPRRRGVHAPAERVRHAPDLLGDEDLLEDREAAAAKVFRHVHREQAELDRLAVVLLPDLLGDLPAVLLGVRLPRDQVFVHEPPGRVLDPPVVLAHRVRAHPPTPPGGSIRRTERRFRWTRPRTPQASMRTAAPSTSRRSACRSSIATVCSSSS